MNDDYDEEWRRLLRWLNAIMWLGLLTAFIVLAVWCRDLLSWVIGE